MVHAHTHIATAETFSLKASARIVGRHLETKTIFVKKARADNIEAGMTISARG
jgi:hypothetical protein